MVDLARAQCFNCPNTVRGRVRGGFRAMVASEDRNYLVFCLWLVAEVRWFGSVMFFLTSPWALGWGFWIGLQQLNNSSTASPTRFALAVSTTLTGFDGVPSKSRV